LGSSLSNGRVKQIIKKKNLQEDVLYILNTIKVAQSAENIWREEMISGRKATKKDFTEGTALES
jgi:hypothetical protein